MYFDAISEIDSFSFNELQSKAAFLRLFVTLRDDYISLTLEKLRLLYSDLPTRLADLLAYLAGNKVVMGLIPRVVISTFSYSELEFCASSHLICTKIKRE